MDKDTMMAPADLIRRLRTCRHEWIEVLQVEFVADRNNQPAMVLVDHGERLCVGKCRCKMGIDVAKGGN